LYQQSFILLHFYGTERQQKSANPTIPLLRGAWSDPIWTEYTEPTQMRGIRQYLFPYQSSDQAFVKERNKAKMLLFICPNIEKKRRSLLISPQIVENVS
jgi:hypothetical protein